MPSDEQWCVEIFSGWRVKPNPEGNGILLCVDRTARHHTQVISDWMKVPACPEDIEAHLDTSPQPDGPTYRQLYATVVERLETLAEVMFREMGWFQAVEMVGLTVHYNLLRGIARGAEREYHSRKGD